MVDADTQRLFDYSDKLWERSRGLQKKSSEQSRRLWELCAASERLLADARAAVALVPLKSSLPSKTSASD